jgi:hypothetical protein
MATARYRELERRLKKLRVRFLPKTFSPTGTYTERQLDHARGYRLLVHAEIEAYLEERAQKLINESVKDFDQHKEAQNILMNLLSFHLNQQQVSMQQLKAIYATNAQHCKVALKKAQSAYNHVVATNNGIREDNVLKILLPLGLDTTKIDSAWLSTLDTFGKNRGEVAHKSIKTHQLINPEDEYNTAVSLLKGLKDLDDELSKLQ